MDKTPAAARRIPIHRLRANEKVWTPPSVVFVDTESRWRTEGTLELHTMRLWVACHVDRRARGARPPSADWGSARTPQSFAAWLDGRTRGRDTVWLYAHNLNYDLVTTDLVTTMGALDWEVSDFSVGGQSPWLRLRKGRKHVTVVDSWTWLPQSVESLAGMVGRSKLPLPELDGEEADWWARCASDVDITARSVLALMDWWDTNALGRWTISGAGCGWNAMRHVPTPQRHVIDPDPELIAQDRRAVRGGRKDAAVVRSAFGGPWVELDLVAAYPTVAKHLPLPVKRGWTFDALPTDSRWVGSRHYGVVADVLITTDRPRYPVRHDGVTWYPVGSFWTTLAGPEIAWAREAGHLVAIGPGQAHRLGYALAPWASWVLDPSAGGTVPTPSVALVACKGWGRSVPGKFAARSHTSEALEGVAPGGWDVMDSWDRPAGRRGAEVAMGGRKWLITYDGDTENCYPAVLGWIESEVRARLGRVLEHLDGAWWTADTDGLLVDMSSPITRLMAGGLKLGRRPRDAMALAAVLCDQLAPMVAPLVIRPKRQVDSLEVLGPQHVTVDGARKFSGLSSKAAEVAPGRFRSRDWPSLKWQMTNSVPGTYVRPEREQAFAGPTVHRWVTADGSTRPVEMTVGPDGANTMVPWHRTRWAVEGTRLAADQYRGLAQVV